jgi:hypothetical protein
MRFAVVFLCGFIVGLGVMAFFDDWLISKGFCPRTMGCPERLSNVKDAVTK